MLERKCKFIIMVTAFVVIGFQGVEVYAENEVNSEHIIATAEKYLGKPYVYGANFGQTNTFDCSSFVKTVFANNNIEIPRVSRHQAKKGKYISKDRLQIGDLVFFTSPNSEGDIGHVGIYAGNELMIHTSLSCGVEYTSINSNWWKKRYVTARRILQ